MTGYHVFCFRIDQQWSRTALTLDDDAFDGFMDTLEWKMPYNMKAFHFNSEKHPPVSVNPVFNAMPVIDLDLMDFFERRIGVRLKSQDQKPKEVTRFGGGFVIVETDDTYGRLLPCSESDELVFNEYFPISFRMAADFVKQHHRHNTAPQSHKFSIGLLKDGKLIGVIIASTPKAKALCDGFTLELNRCCVLPDQRNSCSRLYAKAIQAGRCMGYRRYVTYTLPHESGSSLKAVGFKLDGLTQAKPNGWDHPSRPRKMPERYPTGSKCRWLLYK